jgi:hypothetical protein
MTIVSNFLSSITTMDATPPIVANDKPAYRDLVRLRDDFGFDPALAAGLAAADEVQTLPSNGASAGTFDMTLNLATGPVVVSSIAFNVAVAALETAIDSAASGTVPGWTNGDIAVSGTGTLDANTFTLTYSGASVSQRNHALPTFDNAGMTGGSQTAAAGTEGRPDRNGVAILFEIGYITNYPDHGVAPNDSAPVVADLGTVAPHLRLSHVTLKSLLEQINHDEGVDWFPVVGPKLNLL